VHERVAIIACIHAIPHHYVVVGYGTGAAAVRNSHWSTGQPITCMPSLWCSCTFPGVHVSITHSLVQCAAAPQAFF
jgi:hypothetical protein